MRFSILRPLFFSIVLCVAQGAIAEEVIDYERQVKPLLAEKCYACHGALKQESQLRLDTAAGAVKGGDSGPALNPGQAAASLIIERVTAPADDRMPPEGEPLTSQQIKLLRLWIDQGAEAPDDEQPQLDPRQHWAFQPPQAAAAEKLNKSHLGTEENSIDVILGSIHRRRKLVPAAVAPRNVLLRRVYIDLTGLPPTLEQLDKFLMDDAPDAYMKVVDRLLASSRYGERWGRHWMDVWRYADWSGEINNQVRGSPEHIWRWRDWIVESLNQDVGYDQMVRDMLAADELAPHDQQRLRATGFLARNWYKFNRNVWLDDTIEHTTKAFLGLTFNCAKCHDHKYDPISQQNYYQLRAFFEPHDIRTDPLVGQADSKTDGLVRVFDAMPDKPTYLFHRGQEHQPDKTNPLSPRLPEVLGGNLVLNHVSYVVDDEIVVNSTGRRSALASWITHRRNPLTARVAVNHIWLRHFGMPLVDGITDFGLRSPEPPLAKVLDTLAVDFMNHDWSMKHLHRQIVLSGAYRMRSDFDSLANSKTDPDNRLLWRMNHRRMEGETIRDSVLHLAGELDRAMGGREIPLEQSDTSRRRSIYFRHGHERQVEFLRTFDGASVLECYRRNNTIVPQQALALANSVVIREQSRLIAQRLSTIATRDSTFVQRSFRHLLSREPTEAEQVHCLTFLKSQATLIARGGLTYNEDAPQAKVAAATDPDLRAREGLVHVLLNHNDFVTVR
jgi:hypothetical protein